jgi:hypothetical protein
MIILGLSIHTLGMGLAYTPSLSRALAHVTKRRKGTALAIRTTLLAFCGGFGALGAAFFPDNTFLPAALFIFFISLLPFFITLQLNRRS